MTAVYSTEMEPEQLTQAEFDGHIAAGTLRLAFVGMSNVGKSYRAQVLQDECGFFWYSVDKEILHAFGFAGEDEISKWLGFPNSPDYAKRERQYLDAEARYTRVGSVDTHGKNLVFDTTGSVIHLDDPTIRWLQDYCLLVNIDAGEDSLEKMIHRLTENPKPLVWNGFYKPEIGESEKETLARCYPALLRDRLEKYRSLAHVSIPAFELHDKGGKETLRIVRSRLTEQGRL